MKDKAQATSEQNGHSSSIGACSNLSDDALLSLGPKNRYGEVPAVRLFLNKYLTYPSTVHCDTDDDDTYFHATTILNYIRDELKHDITKDCVARRYSRQAKRRYVDSRLCDLGNGVMIDFASSNLEEDILNKNQLKADFDDKYFLVVSELKIFYLPEHESFAEELSDRFSQMTLPSSKSCILQMVCRNSCGYYLDGVRIKKPLITDLALHYGKSFVPIHDRILKNLNKKESKGIVLLHGLPGSGIYNLKFSYQIFIFLII